MYTRIYHTGWLNFKPRIAAGAGSLILHYSAEKNALLHFRHPPGPPGRADAGSEGGGAWPTVVEGDKGDRRIYWVTWIA
jgi:hypothetical protein